jgi:phosphoglucomutase
MCPHPLAGMPAQQSQLINIQKLVTDYFEAEPDATHSEQKVAFGTSGHRGSSANASFNELHILAIAQALCEVRSARGITGPLFVGIDTHALSEPALATTLEVLAANGVQVRVDAAGGYTPTPVISHAILAYNRNRQAELADGIVITPSHNPPSDGGYKYNPPHGGPADSALTGEIETLANRHLASKCRDVRRISLGKAIAASTTQKYDFLTPYVADLEQIIDFEPIRSAKLRIGAIRWAAQASITLHR